MSVFMGAHATPPGDRSQQPRSCVAPRARGAYRSSVDLASLAPHLFVYGPLGIGWIAAGFVIRALYLDLRAEREARLADAKLHLETFTAERAARLADLRAASQEVLGERAARIEDARRYTETSLLLQGKALETAERLRDAVDTLDGAKDPPPRKR